tara:strand:- start:11692 stop:12603 length:912 start_codon:yes stop_codon:yes gene_type:complete
MNYLVTAIVVTFNPDIVALKNLLQKLNKQVQYVVVVDNASDNVKQIVEIVDMRFFKFLPQNQGIAFAQNIGIQVAKELGVISVIFFDQDSLPCESFVKNLISVKKKSECCGVKVSAIGPFYCDSRTSNYSFYVKSNKSCIAKVIFDAMNDDICEFYECDFLISSGSLIDLTVLSLVGGMREDFFIDGVDIEWCYRASSYGYKSIVASNVTMLHSIGDNVINKFGRDFTINTPIRAYYSIRNMLYLLMLPYVSSVWKRKYLSKIILVSILSIFIYPQKIKRIKALFWSCIDFSIGKSGKCKHRL